MLREGRIDARWRPAFLALFGWPHATTSGTRPSFDHHLLFSSLSNATLTKGSLERRPRDRLDGAASPFKARGAQSIARPSAVRELTAATSPAGAHAVRARREGAPGGGGGGSCSAKRTSKVGLGKMNERQA
ncbi:hypothetical protein T492DRAFT_844176 [Pavlovales sp. CCMP2436]|nr:hypothetical protein T492DRAFT_844176 [Pavlovales sp. CCMP2436]